jgi:SAM-dependent methyltransferase
MSGVSFGPLAWGPLAQALRAYEDGAHETEVIVHSDAGTVEPFPIELLYRRPEDGDRIDREALARARGHVLDAGAGVGAFSLSLQEAGQEVTALEVIPDAVEIMARRGVRKIRSGLFQDLPPDKVFDTIVLLMNGVAMAGSLAGLPPLLQVLRGLLAPGGQVLMDSTDLAGELPVDPGALADGSRGLAGAGGESEGQAYPGDLQYQLEFQGVRGAPFPQLFVDPVTLGRVAAREGWSCQMVAQCQESRFLARLGPV